MDAIFTILKQFACYFLLLSILEQLLSGSQMQKYIRFFSGAVLCISLVVQITQKISPQMLGNFAVREVEERDLDELFARWEEKRQKLSKQLAEEEEKGKEQEKDSEQEEIGVDRIQLEDGHERMENMD